MTKKMETCTLWGPVNVLLPCIVNIKTLGSLLSGPSPKKAVPQWSLDNLAFECCQKSDLAAIRHGGGKPVLSCCLLGIATAPVDFPAKQHGTLKGPGVDSCLHGVRCSMLPLLEGASSAHYQKTVCKQNGKLHGG